MNHYIHDMPSGTTPSGWNTLLERLKGDSGSPAHMQQELLNAVLVLLMVMVMIIANGYYFLQPEDAAHRELSLVATMGFLVPLLVAFYWNRKGRYLRSARFLIATISIGIFGLSFLDMKNNGLEMLFYLIFPVVLSTLLLPLFESILTFALVTLGLLAVRLAVPASDLISVPIATTTFVSLIFLTAGNSMRKMEQERQKAVIQSELRYRTLVERAPEAIVVFSQKQNRIIDSNRKAAELFGYSDEILLTRSLLDLFPPNLIQDPLYRESIFNVLRNAIAHQPPPFECTLQHSSGIKLPCEVWLTSFPGKEEPLIRASILDLRERKEVEDALFRAHLHTQALIEAIQTLAIEIDPNGMVLYWNHHAEQIFAIPADLATRSKIDDLAVSWPWPVIGAAVEQCAAENRVINLHDVKYTRTDDVPGFLELKLIPVRKDRNLLPDVILTGNDITESKMLYEQLYQAEKLRSLGELAAGIAHEINSPMQFISNNLHFLQDGFNILIIPVKI